MGYHQGQSYESMYPVEPMERALWDIADSWGSRTVELTKQNTPIDTSPFPGKTRLPGTLREGIAKTPVTVGVDGAGRRVYRSGAETEDEVAPYVEWDTRPHEIRPKDPEGTLAFPDPDTGEMRFAKVVHHPGTTGQHMFLIGALAAEDELGSVAVQPLAQWKREMEVAR